MRESELEDKLPKRRSMRIDYGSAKGPNLSGIEQSSCDNHRVCKSADLAAEFGLNKICMSQ